MEVTQPLRNIVERAYAADPKATRKDLHALASSELDLQWALMGKELERDEVLVLAKRRIPPGVTKVRARRR